MNATSDDDAGAYRYAVDTSGLARVAIALFCIAGATGMAAFLLGGEHGVPSVSRVVEAIAAGALVGAVNLVALVAAGRFLRRGAASRARAHRDGADAAVPATSARWSSVDIERRRVADELHDRTGANLAAIKLNLRLLNTALGGEAPRFASLMSDNEELLTDTIASIRELGRDLRPAVLDSAGLGPAIEDLVTRFRRRTLIETRFDRASFDGRCTPDLESAVFRVTQEALLNCAKHSGAAHVHVQLSRIDERVVLAIEDDGAGIDPSAIVATGTDAGSGLTMMRERIESVGGTFDVYAAPRAGTRIHVEVDISPRPREVSSSA